MLHSWKTFFSFCSFFIVATTTPAQLTWTQECGPGPQSGYGPGMIYDETRAQTLLFGGAILPSGTVFNDTWVWYGTNWTQQFPATRPPATFNPAMAYDAARGQTVMFGGFQGGAPSAQTWVWDGTNWAQKFPANSPPARYTSAAYDAAHQQVVIFGGSVGTPNPLGDTWVWDGTNWAEKFPINSPPPRNNNLLAYDAARGQVVIFGGNLGSNYGNDTWVWDGTNWAQKFPANSPSPRGLYGFAYDANRQRVVLFSGTVASTGPVDNATWEWDGTNWTQDFPAVSPPQRATYAMAFDEVRNQIVMFGGVDSTPMFADTWVFGAPTASSCPPPLPPTSTIGNAGSTVATDPNGSSTNGGTLQLTGGEPVNTGNGNYFYSHADFTLPGRGLPVVFQRSYNTLDNYVGPLGANWTHSYNITLFQDASGNITVKWGDGHGETYASSGGTYLPQAGVFNTLVKNADGTFALTRKDQTLFAFSTAGRLTSIEDKNGNTVVLNYDTSGNLTGITDTVGRNLSLSYDTGNRILQVIDPIGRTVSFQYDASNNLVQSADPAGGVTTFAYNSNHEVTSITQPNGQTLLTNAYDGLGRVITQTGGRGFAATFSYGTPNPGDTTMIDARGNQTIHSYDSSLRIVKITDALGGMTSFTYDAMNDRASVTNANGKTTNFTYDSRGNVNGITDPLGNTVGFTYDTKNDLLSATNAKGKTTTLSYDAKENLTTIQDVLSNTTTFSYDSLGELISKRDARGNMTAFSYDSSANLTRITDALGHSTNLTYDGIGRLKSITDPNGHTANATYDLLSRLLKIADPLAHQTQFAYDTVGNLLKITDANGNATNYAYDATNNLVTVTDALGRITRYVYDQNNNRTSFVNAKANATSYTYDTVNRLIRISDPLSFATNYSYDAVGNVQAVTDAKGQTNQFAYDALNRLLVISYADGKSVAYSYDSNGNRTTMVDPHGTTTYAYDVLDRLTSVTHPGGKVVAYAFDAVGNRKSVTYPDGKAVNYAYDPANRLSQVTDWLNRITTYSYDAASNLTRTSYPNTAALAFVYDAANRLTNVSNSYRGSSDKPLNPVTGFSYVLDAVGNRLQITDGSGKVKSYGYDALYELTSVTSGTNVTRYTYDAVGNRLSLTAPGTSVNYTYDAADRLLMAGSSSFTYDANGNQTSKTLTATGQPVVYAYDAANRLTSATGGATPSAFAYDGDGNRVSQMVGTGTYNYVNDVATALPVVLQESGPDGFISYAYGLGLVSESGSNFDAFYQYDGLGSIVGLTDPSGKLLGRYGYDAWGQSDLTTPGPQLGTKNKFRFTGEALDPGTQLYYLRARYYDPSVGRFISRDPLRGSIYHPQSIHKYEYSFNDPLRFADHAGLLAVDFINSGPTISIAPPGSRLNTASFDIANSGSTIPIAPPSSGCGVSCAFSITGLVVDVYRVILKNKTLKTFGDVLVLPGLAAGFVSDSSSGVDLGHALGRLGVNAAIQAGIIAVGGPAGLALDVAYDAAYLLFPNQINGAIDVTFNKIGDGVQLVFGINTAY